MINQLKIGVILSYVNNIVNIVIGLIYTPIMIHLLGQAEYGLYSLIGALVGYLSILDMGLGNTIVRYTAKNRVVGDKLSENNLNGLFLVLYCILGILTVGVGAVLYFNIDSMFKDTLSFQEIEKAKIMMILLIFNFAVSFPLGVFASIMQAYERFVFLRVCNILRTVLNPLLVLPCLYSGYGSIMMVVVSTFLNISCLLVNLYYCFKYLKVKFCFGKYEPKFLKEISGYSFFIFLEAIMNKVYWSTGQFILGIVSGTLEVAVYAIAMQFIAIYTSFSTAVSGIILPKITMMVANKVDNIELTNFMIKIGRIQYIVMGYIVSAFVFCGYEFLYLWAGESYLDAYSIISIIMIALFIPLIQNAGIAVLQAKNLNKFRMIVYTIIAFGNILISIPLARYYGGIGCAIATSGALLISTGIIMNIYYYKIGLDMLLFWKNIIKLSKSLVIVFMISWIFKSVVILEDSWGNFIIEVVFFTLIYGKVIFSIGMNYYEKKLVLNLKDKICRRFGNL